jgi:ABC-type multidrug transport system fused ATPase/permease subunit
MAQPREGKSLILISHRLSNLRPADQILVLEAGRLVEAGRHDALVEAGGAYAEMFALQAEAYR